MKENIKSICERIHFQLIFKTHSKTLRNYIYYKSGDPDLADDILQEAFIKLWENCNTVAFDNALFFLKSVSKNAFLNIVKHKNVILRHKNNNTAEHIDHQSPQFILEEQEYAHKVKKAIANLPEKEREVFLLNRIDRMKYKDMAVLLEISIKTVEKRMHNALLVMRKEIGRI